MINSNKLQGSNFTLDPPSNMIEINVLIKRRGYTRVIMVKVGTRTCCTMCKIILHWEKTFPGSKTVGNFSLVMIEWELQFYAHVPIHSLFIFFPFARKILQGITKTWKSLNLLRAVCNVDSHRAANLLQSLCKILSITTVPLGVNKNPIAQVYCAVEGIASHFPGPISSLGVISVLKNK